MRNTNPAYKRMGSGRRCFEIEGLRKDNHFPTDSHVPCRQEVSCHYVVCSQSSTQVRFCWVSCHHRFYWIISRAPLSSNLPVLLTVVCRPHCCADITARLMFVLYLSHFCADVTFHSLAFRLQGLRGGLRRRMQQNFAVVHPIVYHRGLHRSLQVKHVILYSVTLRNPSKLVRQNGISRTP